MSNEPTGIGTATAAHENTTNETPERAIDPTSLTNKSAIETHETNLAGQTFAQDQKGVDAGETIIDGEASTTHVTGFASFRLWCNKRIRNSTRRVELNYANQVQAVTEITHDGRIRLENHGEARLIPLDERYIPALLEQLL